MLVVHMLFSVCFVHTFVWSKLGGGGPRAGNFPRPGACEGAVDWCTGVCVLVVFFCFSALAPGGLSLRKMRGKACWKAKFCYRVCWGVLGCAGSVLAVCLRCAAWFD